jgi:integrase
LHFLARAYIVPIQTKSGDSMRDKITKRSIDALCAEAKASGKTHYVWDTETTGFGALCTKTGSCSYFIEYRLGGRGTPSRRVTLGKHGIFTPDEARKVAREELGKVARGTDVAQVRKDERDKLTGLTFKDAVERYLAIHGRDTRYWRQKRTRLESGDVKAFRERPLATIERAQIVAALDVVQQRAHSAARVLFSDMRPIFAWALDRAAIEKNPMLGMRGPASSEARDRVLSDAEIRAFWQAAGEQGHLFEHVFKLLLLTAQRREEVAGMRRREIDLDNTTWTIARERCKNGKAHTVDLCPEAAAMLDPLGEKAAPRRLKTTDDLVFSTTGTAPVSGFSNAKARLDARMRELLGDKFQPWRTHDLRRTAASGMAALGLPPHVIERVLNHMSGAQGGLVGVYQRHEYREERKRAILAWGERVAAIVGGEKAPSNVISLKRAV